MSDDRGTRSGHRLADHALIATKILMRAGRHVSTT